MGFPSLSGRPSLDRAKQRGAVGEPDLREVPKAGGRHGGDHLEHTIRRLIGETALDLPGVGLDVGEDEFLALRQRRAGLGHLTVHGEDERVLIPAGQVRGVLDEELPDPLEHLVHQLELVDDLAVWTDRVHGCAGPAIHEGLMRRDHPEHGPVRLLCLPQILTGGRRKGAAALAGLRSAVRKRMSSFEIGSIFIRTAISLGPEARSAPARPPCRTGRPP